MGFKKFRFFKGAALMAAVCFTAAIVAACTVEVPKYPKTLEEVYAAAQELGYTGTFEELLESLRGEAGKDGKDGVGIKNLTVNEDGELFAELTDGTTVSCGKVKGKDGKDGTNGRDGVDGKDGKDGVNGLGISRVYIDERGHLFLVLTDGTELDCGCVVGRDGVDGKDGANGKDGKDGVNGVDGADGKDGLNGTNGRDGVGIKSVELSEDGDLTVTFTDGTQTVLGNIKGKDGLNGTNGTNGKDGTNGVDGKDGVNGQDGKDGTNGVDGKDGKDGLNGKDGVGIKRVYFDEAGNLIIEYTDGTCVNLGPVKGESGEKGDTGAQGEKGDTGAPGEKGEDGKDGQDGQDGKDGLTPHIGPDGDWWIGDEDTDIPAGCRHSFSDWETVVSPTCTSVGYDTRTCSECGETEFRFFEATGHRGGELAVTLKESTCREHGTGIYVCPDCSAAYRAELPLLPHSYEKDGECSVCHAIRPAENLLYETRGDHAAVVGLGKTSETKLAILSEYEGLPVTEIAENAFKNCDTLTVVLLPERIERIGAKAFFQCGSLARVDGLERVEIFGESAFYRCTSLEGADLSAATEVGDAAFQGCSGLSSVTFAAVETIGANAFSGCEMLSSIVLPASLRSLGAGAFAQTALFSAFFAEPEGWTEKETGEPVRSFGNEAAAAELLLSSEYGFERA